MIGRVRGEVMDRQDLAHHSLITVDINGMGIEVMVPKSDISTGSVGERIDLFTDFIVREDSMTLYGFSSSARRSLFRMLQTVSGVGPKVALTMMATTQTEELSAAIVDGDLHYLEQIPGIGKKVASRITLELREKMDLPASGAQSNVRRTVTAALINLGYGEKEAQDASAEISISTDIESALKEALSRLNRASRQ